MINTKQFPKIILLFVFVVLVLNLLQSAFTELIFDEAYYWYFSQNLSWGYFDHPPMVAFLAYIGNHLFGGELGVRFLLPFLYAVNILLLWVLIDDKRKYQYIFLFVLLMSGMGLLSVYGFFMLPDAPLITFGILFLWAYKRFLEKEDYIAVLVLGISMAAVMYSKYHGILIIGFTFLSNIAILKKKKFWFAIAVSLFFYTPHLIWIFSVDFAPLKYHFFERVNDAYEIEYFTTYLLNCIAIAGLLFPFMYWALFKTITVNKFDKALKYIAYGIFLFFFISSLSRKTQIQWVILIIIPLIIFTYRYALVHSTFRKWVCRLSIVSIFILCVARVMLVFESLSPVAYETHGNKQWVTSLQKQVNNLPVVFNNSYRNASMYAFYSQGVTFSYNDANYRRNQYDLDDSELKVRNQKVAYIVRDNSFKIDSTIGARIPFRNKRIKGLILNNFESYQKVRLRYDKDKISLDELSSFGVSLSNPYQETLCIDSLNFGGIFYNYHKGTLKSFPLIISAKNTHISKDETISLQVSIPDTVSTEEAVFFRMGIINNSIYPGFQGEMIRLSN